MSGVTRRFRLRKELVEGVFVDLGGDGARRGLGGGAFGGAHAAEDPLVAQGRGGGEGGEVVVAGFEERGEGRAAVDLLGERGGQRVERVAGAGEGLAVDLPGGVEGGEGGLEVVPLVGAAEPFEHEALDAGGDGAVDLDALQGVGAEAGGEAPVVPPEHAVDGALAAEEAGRGVDHLAVAEGERAALGGGVDLDDPGLAPEVDGGEQVDEAHAPELAREARARRGRQRLAAPARQHELHAREQLLQVDGLREVVLDAQPQPPDLVVEVHRARQEHERHPRPRLVGLQPLAEVVAVARHER
ncbi:MAG: hypothetical protein U0324_05010 [Polyangiales bacterium]